MGFKAFPSRPAVIFSSRRLTSTLGSPKLLPVLYVVSIAVAWAWYLGESREVERQQAGRFKFRFPAASRSFALFENVETVPWIHSASFSVGVERLSPAVKRPGS
jgi:hypothetical protein